MGSWLLEIHKNPFTEGEDTGTDIFQYGIASNDAGFYSAVKKGLSAVELEAVKYFSELIHFIDYLERIDMQSEYLMRYLCSKYGIEMHEHTIKEAFAITRLVMTLGETALKNRTLSKLKFRAPQFMF